jgi:hypothetical protein
LSVKNVSAHYVGDAVIVDFQLENKSKKNITDLSLSVEGKDVIPVPKAISNMVSLQ